MRERSLHRTAKKCHVGVGREGRMCQSPPHDFAKFMRRSARDAFITQYESFSIQAWRPSRQKGVFVWSLYLYCSVIVIFISFKNIVQYLFTYIILRNMHLILIRTYISEALYTI